MADTKISALAAVATPAATDEFAVNQGGTSKKMTLAQVHASAWTGLLVSSGDATTGADQNFVDVPGCVFTYETNSTYVVDIYGFAQSASAATVGYGMAFNVSSAVTSVSLTFFHQLANTGTLSGGSSIADDTGTGVSTGVPASATNVPIYGGGLLITGANTGTAQLRWRSETNSVTALKAGAVMRVMKVA